MRFDGEVDSGEADSKPLEVIEEKDECSKPCRGERQESPYKAVRPYKVVGGQD